MAHPYTPALPTRTPAMPPTLRDVVQKHYRSVKFEVQWASQGSDMVVWILVRGAGMVTPNEASARADRVFVSGRMVVVVSQVGPADRVRGLAGNPSVERGSTDWSFMCWKAFAEHLEVDHLRD